MRRRLRSRINTRSAVVLALATAGILAVAGVALATGSSTVPGFSFAPNNPHGVFTSGKLSLHTHTNYTGSTTTNRIQLQFDDDFQFNPDAFPKCNRANLAGNPTMRTALALCGGAWLWPANSGTSNGTAQLQRLDGLGTYKACVLVFNGLGSQAELLLFMRIRTVDTNPISCANPRNSLAGNTSKVLIGDSRANPAIGGDYTDLDSCSAPDPRRGCQIDINNINNVLFGQPQFLRLTDLNIGAQRGTYIRARCVDPPAGNRKWNLQAKLTYGDNSTQTVNKSQTCT
jgi:hypothetical protein